MFPTNGSTASPCSPATGSTSGSGQENVGSDDGQLDRPSGLAIDADDNVWVVDGNNHRIQKFTPGGKFLMKIGSHGQGDGEFDQPWGIDIDRQGNIYVADWRNDRIQKFSSSGDFLMKFGSSGDGDGEFNRPRRCSR